LRRANPGTDQVTGSAQTERMTVMIDHNTAGANKEIIRNVLNSVPDVARSLIEAGFYPVPVKPGKKAPAGGDNWQDKTFTPEDFRPGMNIGVHLLPEGDLAMVDRDCEESYQLRGRFLPETRMSGRASKPESHAWYFVDGEPPMLQLKDGQMVVELRYGKGKQTLIPPSKHPDYDEHYVTANPDTPITRITAEELERGVRMEAAACVIARHYPPPGGQYDFGLHLAGYLITNGVSEDDVFELMMAAKELQPEPLDKDAEKNIRGVCQSAARKKAAGVKEITGGGRLKEEYDEKLPSRLAYVLGWKKTNMGGAKPDQIDLVDRWRERNPDIRFGAGSWRRYQNGYWPKISEVEVERGLLDIIKEARSEGVKPSANLLNSVTALARVEVRVPEHVWDNPERGIIVCQNGTLEINGRRLREHRPEDYSLYAVAFAYDPVAKAEFWEEAFAPRLGKSWEFLQEYAGYALTTRTEHETAVFLLGDPGCGKSTFVEGVTTVLGERSKPLSLASLVQSKFALSSVPGRTLLTATEAPHLYLKSTAILDTLISGEEMEFERKYEKPESFRPVAKVLWAMNETPQVRNPNAGFFRRVKIVQFPSLGDTKRNPLVKELIKTEGSGILNWALDGLDRLNAQRTFTVSPEMEEAGQAFRQENDIPALFVAEMCEVESGTRVKGSELYRRYTEWCRDSGHNPIGKNRIGKEWQRLGFKEVRPQNVPHYVGLELRERSHVS
jgi:P4 family phage/plasmid primase-like protien